MGSPQHCLVTSFNPFRHFPRLRKGFICPLLAFVFFEDCERDGLAFFNGFFYDYFAATYLKDYGYEIIPVNPTYSEVMGFKAYPNLDAVVKAGIALEVVDIFRKPEEVPAIVNDAIRLGAKVIWMQLGVIHEGARDTAKAAGLDVVMDRCMKIEHARFHGGLNFAGIRTNLVSARKPHMKLLP